jgi:hypothetical protein
LNSISLYFPEGGLLVVEKKFAMVIESMKSEVSNEFSARTTRNMSPKILNLRV